MSSVKNAVEAGLSMPKILLRLCAVAI